MNLQMNGKACYVRNRPYIHREREDAWCFGVDLERALATLPYDLRVLYHLQEEGYRDREICSRFGIPCDELPTLRAELARRLRSELRDA